MRALAGALLLISLTGCRRDDGVWPKEVLDDVLAKCPDALGDASLCDCVVRQISNQIPYRRMQKWGFALNPAFGSELFVAEQALLKCGGNAKPSPYPPAMRTRLIQTCITRSATKRACECFASSVEAHVPLHQWVAIGFRAARVGESSVSAFFVDAGIPPDGASCFAFVDELAPWPLRMIDGLARECESQGASPDFCRCYAAKVPTTVTYAELMREAVRDGGVSTVVQRLDAAAQACAEPLPPKGSLR